MNKVEMLSIMGIELLKIENKKMKSDIDAMNEYIKDLQQMVNMPDVRITTCPECNKKYSVNYCRETYKLKQQLKQIREYCEKQLKKQTLEERQYDETWESMEDILEILNSGGAE